MEANSYSDQLDALEKESVDHAMTLSNIAQGLSLGADGMGWSPDPKQLIAAADHIEKLSRLLRAPQPEPSREWNEAIEAAATLADVPPFSATDLSRRIRALKRNDATRGEGG